MSYTTKTLTDASTLSDTSVGSVGNTTSVTGWEDANGGVWHVASHLIVSADGSSDQLVVVYSINNNVLNQEVVIDYPAGLDVSRDILRFRWYDFGSHSEYVQVFFNLDGGILVFDTDSSGIPQSPSTPGTLGLDHTSSYRVRCRVESSSGNTTLTIQITNLTANSPHIWFGGSDTGMWTWPQITSHVGQFQLIADGASQAGYMKIDYRDDQPPPTPQYGTLSITGQTTSSISVQTTAATGGTPPYSYLWEAADSIYGSWTAVSTSTSFTESSLPADTARCYRLTITDSLAQQALPDPTATGAGCVGASTLRRSPIAMILYQIGDSITAGGSPQSVVVAATNLSSWLGTTCTATGSGIGGSAVSGWVNPDGTPTSALSTATSDAANKRVTDFLERLGTNDFESSSAFATGIQQIIANLRSGSIPTLQRIWLLTPIYRYAPPWGPSQAEAARLRSFESSLTQIAQSDSGANGVKVYVANFEDYDRYMTDPTLYGGDGIHPSQSGYNLLGQLDAMHIYSVIRDMQLPTIGSLPLIIG